MLKVADKTLYPVALCGEVLAFDVRGQWRFKRDDLDERIEQQKLSLRGHDKPYGGRG